MARGRHIRRLSRATRQKFREGETKAAAKVEQKAADEQEKAEKKAAVKKAAERSS